MDVDCVPLEERPSTRQIEELRRTREKGPAPFPTDTILLLEHFLSHPPPDVHIFSEHVTLTTTDIRIPFTCTEMWNQADVFAHFPCFLMDYTFNTNCHGLLLGSCGPCGLHIARSSHLPAMRFIPAVFCICRSEDERAHTILFQIFEEWRATAAQAVPLTDGFFDYACLVSASKYFGDRQVFLPGLRRSSVRTFNKSSQKLFRVRVRFSAPLCTCLACSSSLCRARF